MKVLLVKHLSSFRAVDEAGEDLLRKLGQGEVVAAEVKRPQNVRFHRKFWALATLVHGQIDHERWPTVEDLVTEFKLRTGHYDRRDIEVEGRRYPVLTPRSISFAAMDATEFEAFFDRVCDHVARDILPGVSRADLREELEHITGARVGA